jgi:Tol biopolymer transport system component
LVPEALIEEARQRARRRRLRNVAAALVVGLGAVSLYGAIAGRGVDDTPSVVARGPAASAASDDPLPEALSYSAGEVWIVSRPGHQRRLTTVGVLGSAWSPDGTRLLGMQEDSVVIVGSDGHIDPVARGANGFVRPSWSPDGTRIAFHRRARGIYVVESDGTSARRVARDAPEHAYASISWSPDGRELVYGTTDGVFVVPADGSREPELVPMPLDPIGPGPYPPGFGQASWSPDGSYIAFDFSGRVYVVRPDGTGLRRLQAGANAVWSPDGTKLAFLYEGFDAAVVGVDGTGFRRFPACRCDLRGPGFWPSLSWSSDGSRIAYISGHGNVVSTVRPDGTGVTRVAVQPAAQYNGPWQPVWRPAGRS